ncbi:MAG: hypothetical protein IJC31_08115 [Spirochaetaceae bacterium]|nr:hypothetical protein [Spirochaetaceae bacterium]MBQ8383992.1 hypothetical protein [Spirochaetaceae bacterium]
MSKEHATYFKAAFEKINSKIDTLLYKKDELKGWWIFKAHKYSQQELFESNEYKTISALVLKIEDDISHWGKSLSIKDRAIYNTNRDLLEERLNDVERQIRSRTPTNWEKLKNFFSKFIDFVLEHLPKIWNGLRIAAKTLSNVKGLEWLGKGVNAIDKTIGKFISSRLPEKYKYISK